MEAGKLNNRITIQTYTDTKDSKGQKIKVWSDAFTIWAEVVSSTSREFYNAQKNNSETEIVFKVRYRTGITTLKRIKYNGVYYEIVGDPVDVKGQRKELLISAKVIT